MTNKKLFNFIFYDNMVIEYHSDSSENNDEDDDDEKKNNQINEEIICLFLLSVPSSKKFSDFIKIV